MTIPDEHLTEAREAGKRAAEAAASWTCDGNSDPASALRILRMLRDGDPEGEHYLPRTPNLSGEMADDPTPLSLARDVTGDEDPDPETIDALADAFDEGVTEAFGPACERELIACLPDGVTL